MGTNPGRRAEPRRHVGISSGTTLAGGENAIQRQAGLILFQLVTARFYLLVAHF